MIKDLEHNKRMLQRCINRLFITNDLEELNDRKEYIKRYVNNIILIRQKEIEEIESEGSK